MKTNAPLAAVFLLAGLAGCETRPATTVMDRPRVHLVDANLTRYLDIGQPAATRVGAGQLQVSVPVHNTSPDELLLDYQAAFSSPGAGAVEPPTGWADLRIAPHATGVITVTSYTAAARDFDVNIRDAR